MKIYCTKCNYRFDSEDIPFRCPYCGKSSSMEKEIDAQEMILGP